MEDPKLYMLNEQDKKIAELQKEIALLEDDNTLLKRRYNNLMIASSLSAIEIAKDIEMKAEKIGSLEAMIKLWEQRNRVQVEEIERLKNAGIGFYRDVEDILCDQRWYDIENALEAYVKAMGEVK